MAIDELTSQHGGDRNTVRLLGVAFDALTLEQTVAHIRRSAATRQRLFLSTANVNFVVTAASDPEFRSSLEASDLCVADGAPIVWFSRLFGRSLPERVAGADVFDALRADCGEPLTVYFFGGPPGAAERAAAVVNAEARGIRCVGYDCPGFGTVDAMSGGEYIARINAAAPDFVVVALGARKGQAWIMRNRDLLEAAVICHLGAVVNFVAGDIRRAPQWVRKLGLEWTWRIWEEPALGQRYFKDAIGLTRLAIADIGLRLRGREPHAHER